MRHPCTYSTSLNPLYVNHGQFAEFCKLHLDVDPPSTHESRQQLRICQKLRQVWRSLSICIVSHHWQHQGHRKLAEDTTAIATHHCARGLTRLIHASTGQYMLSHDPTTLSLSHTPSSQLKGATSHAEMIFQLAYCAASSSSCQKARYSPSRIVEIVDANSLASMHDVVKTFSPLTICLWSSAHNPTCSNVRSACR